MGKITVKGQVTIPQGIRERYGMIADSEVEFVEDAGRVYLVPSEPKRPSADRFRKVRGTATVRMGTDEIMALLRSGE